MNACRFKYAVLAASFMLAWASPAQDVQVAASVDADEIGLQDRLQLTITVSGPDSGDAEAPRLPGFAGFDVVGGPSVSTQFQWINGRTSSSRSYTYILAPKKTGTHMIDAVEVRVGGKVFRTEPVAVKVRAGSVRPSQPRSIDPFGDEGLIPRRSASGNNVFVEAEIDRKRAYPGQQVTLTYHLYTRVGVTGLQLQESPPLTGFWLEEIDVDKNPRPERKIIGGNEYLDYVIKRQALFPNAPGKLKIPAATFAVSARTGGEFFGIFTQSETLYRKTNELSIEVLPLPAEQRPADFHGAVGSFNLTASLDKNQVAAGEAVSLLIRIAGRGNLKMVPDVALPQLLDFTIYSSKQAANVRVFEGKWIGGDKTWEYVLVPKAPGEQVIPPITLVHFDPEKNVYETLRTAPMPVKVVRGTGAGGALSGLSGIGKQPLTRQGTDINFIKLTEPSLSAARKPPYRSPWFYLLFALPLGANIALLLYRRERRRQLSDVGLARSRRARRTALARLRKAAKAGRENPRGFYDDAAASLSGYIADKFNVPEIALASDQLERTLTARGIGPELIREAIACLEECDFGRFVTASGSPERACQLTRRISKLINALEES
ncbi:MAG: protein BatD [Acidobacteria bacterium]|nr:protein BatD [Acidobacteriota bacterium]